MSRYLFAIFLAASLTGCSAHEPASLDIGRRACRRAVGYGGELRSNSCAPCAEAATSALVERGHTAEVVTCDETRYRQAHALTVVETAEGPWIIDPSRGWVATYPAGKDPCETYRRRSFPPRGRGSR